MHPIVELLVTVATLIVGVAVLALIVSPKANTVGVIQATASGFGNALAVAQSPVTGAEVNIDLSYPTNGFGIGNMSLGGFQ